MSQHTSLPLLPLLLAVALIALLLAYIQVSYKWASLVAEEFYQQTERERELGLPVSPLMERGDRSHQANREKGFIDFVVGPHWMALVRHSHRHSLNYNLVLDYNHSLNHNQNRWCFLEYRLLLFQRCSRV